MSFSHSLFTARRNNQQKKPHNPEIMLFRKKLAKIKSIVYFSWPLLKDLYGSVYKPTFENIIKDLIDNQEIEKCISFCKGPSDNLSKLFTRISYFLQRESHFNFHHPTICALRNYSWALSRCWNKKDRENFNAALVNVNTELADQIRLNIDNIHHYWINLTTKTEEVLTRLEWPNAENLAKEYVEYSLKLSNESHEIQQELGKTAIRARRKRN